MASAWKMVDSVNNITLSIRYFHFACGASRFLSELLFSNGILGNIPAQISLITLI